MSTQYPVSVILPVYNAEKYLTQCLDRLLNQTMKDIEIICVDDGSTDLSRSILQNYACIDSRITVLSQENSGAGAARNLALRVSRGEYISFLDADDCYASTSCLQGLYDAAKRMDASICGGFRQMLNPNGTITPHPLFRYLLKRKPNEMKIAYKDYQYDYHFQNFLFQRALLERNHIEFPLHRRFQDPPFLVRAMIAAGEFAVIPVEVYLYRLSDSSIVWDSEKVGGLIKGLTENLILSREANMAGLHALTVRRVEQDFLEAIAGQIDVPEIYDLCNRANEAVDFRLLRGRRTKPEEDMLLPLRIREQNLCGANSSNGSHMKSFGQKTRARSQALRGLTQCLREHGVGYTIRRGIEHLGIPMNAEHKRPGCRESKSL